MFAKDYSRAYISKPYCHCDFTSLDVGDPFLSVVVVVVECHTGSEKLVSHFLGHHMFRSPWIELQVTFVYLNSTHLCWSFFHSTLFATPQSGDQKRLFSSFRLL